MPETEEPSRTTAARTNLEIIEIPLGDPRIKEFVHFHWQLYKGDPFWTPQLNSDLLGNKILGTVGLLKPENPYHESAKATHFMAYRKSRPVGRISAVVNNRYNEYYDSKIGNFGFFEVENDYEAAEALLDAARDWIKAQGMSVMRGPGEYGNATHERQACLIDGFDTPPAVELTHNPPYYREFFERYGLAKAKDYHAYLLDLTLPVSERLLKTAELVQQRRNIVTRPVDMSRFVEDIRLVIELYNKAWAENWGFLPVTQEEADALAESLKPIIDPGLIRFAYIDDDPVAVIGTFPDPNWAFRPRWKWYGDNDFVRIARLFLTKKHFPRVRLMFFGVVPGHRRTGVDALLFKEVHDHASKHGYTTCDISMLLENNDLILRASEFMGAHRYKTWRIFDLPLE
jgi:GNAT superfamily N-acetyltransferase